MIARNHNVLLYGERGSGKTFLLKLIDEEIKVKNSQIFACFVNIASLRAYEPGDEISSFPRAVLLQLCSSLWTNLLGKSYLDLRDHLHDTGREIAIKMKDEKIIQRIYTQLMKKHGVGGYKFTNSIGVSAGVKGSKKEEKEFQSHHSEILPFEFAEFANEIISNVLIPNNKKRIIILCDEANHMPLFKQEEILERYFDLFGSKKLQFLFVAGLVPWDNKPFLPSCFETRLELLGFPEKADLINLIEKYGPIEIFTGEAIDLLFEAYKGHPRDSLEACGRAFDLSKELVQDNIEASLMFRAIKEKNEFKKRYEEQMIRERMMLKS